MNSKFKITIPKPCHENWNTMTPKEKGRFCSSCSKTVIDFTKKSASEIQDYLVENKNQRVCGHFYKKQLDSITIVIPQVTFQQQLSFQKLFVLALFFVMGTTLFSCQYTDGKKQKIENVIIRDSFKIIEEDIGLTFKVYDSIKFEKNSIMNPKKVKVPSVPTAINPGLTICQKTSKKDSIVNTTTVRELQIEGEIIIDGDINYEEIVGDLNYEEVEKDTDIGFVIVEEPPKFKSSKKLSSEKARKEFDKKMKDFFKENFNFETAQNLGLRNGKHRIFFLIVIDKDGKVSETKVRAPHPTLKNETIKTLEKLPDFIPGKQNGEFVKTRYTFPFTFLVE